MIDKTLQHELAATLLKKILPAELQEEALKSLDEEIAKTSPTENLREETSDSTENLREETSATKNFSASDRAAVLVEALPYIQEFHGKTIVIKYGGNAMVNDELKASVMQDVALMKYVGINVVIVHGGGPEITGFLKKLGKESSFVSGLRVTDEETVEIAEMVLDGKINSEIVTLLNRRGLRAVGLSGKDADLIQATKKLATVYEQGEKTKVDIGYVGKAKQVNIQIVNDLLERGYVPVIAPIGVGEDGESYNINADYVAADIAGALHAEKLLLLTDTEGVYKNFEDKKSFISTLKSDEARTFIKDGTISGGMIPKVEACLRAIDAGTNKAYIIDGRLPHSIILELFTAQGIGTEVK
ncbi:MAG: acetylglutamate kinase [Selenomonadaceae bacterium]|nr:acetylglutamate kinase [Selenomonadaceae bacterium]